MVRHNASISVVLALAEDSAVSSTVAAVAVLSAACLGAVSAAADLIVSVAADLGVASAVVALGTTAVSVAADFSAIKYQLRWIKGRYPW